MYTIRFKHFNYILEKNSLPFARYAWHIAFRAAGRFKVCFVNKGFSSQYIISWSTVNPVTLWPCVARAVLHQCVANVIFLWRMNIQIYICYCQLLTNECQNIFSCLHFHEWMSEYICPCSIFTNEYTNIFKWKILI